LTDTQRRFVAVNREYCKTYGYDPSELLGNEFTMVVPGEQREAAARLHDEFLFREQGEVTGEWRVVRKDGSIRTILVTVGRLELDDTPYKITTVYDMRGRSLASNLDENQHNALREVNHRVKNHLNSLKHAVPQGNSGWISLSVKSAGTHIEARVSDSGPGLPADYLGQNRETLGMQIVTAIVGQHDGEFYVEDAETSTFLVRLPRLMD
jgi:PAS domain S-box-containing protein